jgi:hypothetical protein
MGPQPRAPLVPGPDEPDVSAIVTEDDRPVDNWGSEKQMRLLTEPLYTSWSGPPPLDDGAPRPFAVAANVGLFPAVREPPLVPDVFLSVDVQARQDLWRKQNRSYFFWEFGKPPDVVIEIVSNRGGDELGHKKRRYARMRIAHYVVWDPAHHLGDVELRTFELRGDLFVAVDEPVFDALGLGLVLWNGTFEGLDEKWLRWKPPPAYSSRRGRSARQRKGAAPTQNGSERERADAERDRRQLVEAQARQLRERLLELGVDPDADG